MFFCKPSLSSAAPRCFEAKPWARGWTHEHFPWQYFLHLSAAALPPVLLSHERLNFLLCGRTELEALRAKAPRNTGGVDGRHGMSGWEGARAGRTQRLHYCRTHGRHPSAAAWPGKSSHSSCAVGDPCKIPRLGLLALPKHTPQPPS